MANGKPGRPPKNVDPKRVIYLASIGCTVEEIAALENCNFKTILRRFGSECERGRLLRNAQVRRKQIEKALAGDGDTTMLIWLGKQFLGQRDRHELETTWTKIGYGGLDVPERPELGPADKPN